MLDEITLDDGTTRRLGNIAPPKGLVRGFRQYGSKDDEPLIPRSEWAAIVDAVGHDSESQFLPYVHDQNGIGQCNADATAAAVEFARNVQGLPFVKLSAADLYDRINGGRDQGSLLEDAMHEMTARGIGTAATSGLLWKRGLRQASGEERQQYKALEICVCPTFDHVFSAVAKGRPIVSGIMWFDNYKPDKDGWLPRGRGNSGGHAIFGYKPAMRNGVAGVWHQNSWTEQYGLGGRFVIPESAYAGDVGGWWAIRSVTDEGV